MVGLISVPAQYAVRTLVSLAGRPAAEISRVRDIAEAEGIPYPFLAKIVGLMVQEGLLDSFKGPSGGVRLAQPPHKITLAQVCGCIDGEEPLGDCILGLHDCSEAAPCALHEQWRDIRERLAGRLFGTTIAELAAGRNLDGVGIK